ncbi:MAG: hypothetical protein ACRD1D_14960 [Acidimicrobiales bacterium]
MRARPRAVAAAMVVLSGCTGGDGTGEGPPATTSTTASTVASTTTTTTSTIARIPVPPGAVTLAVRDFTLPEERSGGTGLRLLVRAESARLSVHRRGGGGGVKACPVGGPATPVTPGDCTDLGPGATVEVASRTGVELRATGPGASMVEEVGLTYVAVDRTTTVVTPARPAGACAARACQAAFTLTPGRPGEFTLDGRAGGGRPRLVLESAPAGTPATGGSGSNRTLATVEGGGSLSIRATIEAGREAVLLHHEQGPDAVAPVTAEISWP